MDDMCTACLCIGRNLYFIGETGHYHLYSQILNEIPVYDFSDVCVRVCWECREVLRRFGQFKALVKRSYTELLQQVHQNNPPTKLSLVRSPRLQVQNVINICYPDQEVKQETRDEDVAVDAVELAEPTCVDQVKVEVVDVFDKVEVVVEMKKSKKTSKEKTKKAKIKVKKKKLPLKSGKKKEVSRKKTPEVFNDQSNDDGDGEANCDIDDGFTDNNIEDVTEEADVIKNNVELKEEEQSESVQKKENGKVADDKISQPAVVGGKIKCAECGKLFSSKKTYRYHLNTLHRGQNRFPCPRCGKEYQWKSNLGRHMRSHRARDAGELHCGPCDRRFASVATYTQHLRLSRRHVAERDFSFVCVECGKRFVNKTRLRDHTDWEHLHKVKFRCQLCDKPFKCHTSLYVHMQNVHHNNKKENLCHICGKSYQNAAKLKYHIVAMHTSETPYTCAHCGAAFSWYSSLYRHTREVHHKMKLQPKKTRKQKRGELLPPMLATHDLMMPQPGPV